MEYQTPLFFNINFIKFIRKCQKATNSYRSLSKYSAYTLPLTGSVTYRHCRLPALSLTGTAAYRHCHLPALPLTGTVTYRHCRLPALSLTGTTAYRHCHLSALSLIGTVTYRHYRLPALPLTGTVTYRHYRLPALSLIGTVTYWHWLDAESLLKTGLFNKNIEAGCLITTYFRNTVFKRTITTFVEGITLVLTRYRVLVVLHVPGRYHSCWHREV